MSAPTTARAPGGDPAARLDAVVVGGSAGAIEALTRLLGRLPASFRTPLVVVIHMPRRRASVLSEVLSSHGRGEVREAQDKEPLAPATVHLAPPDYHLLLDHGPLLALSVDEPVNFSMPSVDVLFESAAAVLGARVAGVVLSGANDDGARGLRAIEDAGGVALVQAPEEASVPAMPLAALARCARARPLTVEALAAELARLGAAGESP